MKRLLSALLFGFIILCISEQSIASHITGGQIGYMYLGNNGLDYRVTYTFYRDCAGINAPFNVTIVTSSANCSVNFNTFAPRIAGPTQVVPICPSANTTCTGGSTPGREEYIYQADITLPSKCTDWVFSVTLNARNNAITTINPTGVPMYVESTLNNTIFPYNNASVFANNPAAFIYANQNFCFNNGTVDIDGDSLVYTMITPKRSSTLNVNYIFPYTATQPLSSTPPVTFDSFTGDVCMTPTALEVTVMAILVEEYRFGTLIGSVERDIQVSVLAGADELPYMDGINGTNIYKDTIVAGCDYTFTTQSYDNDALQCVTMTSNVGVAIPAATFTVVDGCPSLVRPKGTFNWTPNGGDIRPQPYVFTVTVRDNYCDIEGQQVKAFQLWVIDFTADFTSSAPGCVGQDVNFYSVQPYKPTYQYNWDFGSGAVFTLQQDTSANPVGVTYTTPGAKTVTLTIIGPGGCNVTKSKVITINPSPTVSFTSTAPQCKGSVVDFTNTGTTGNGVSYFWDFGSGAMPATSTAENPSGILYTTSGTKTVTFNITNQFGCTDADVQSITIDPTPTADFASTAPGCTGLGIDFTNTGTTGVNYSWDFGSGATPPTSTLENPSGIVYSTPGSKIITLITDNGTCSDTSIQTITINETPAVSFTSSAPQCAGSGVDFTNTGSSGFNWNFDWDFGQDASPTVSSSENPTGVSYSTGGTKLVTFTISDQYCSNTDTQSIVINVTPVADFSTTAPKCTGLDVDFTNTGTTGVNYSWDLGSGATPATSTLENPTGIVYSTPGSKIITLITDNGTCSDTSIQTITINETPAVSFTSSSPQCAGSGVDFTNTGSSGFNWNFDWDFGQDASPTVSSSENPTGVNYSTGGTKLVTFTISDQYCSNTDTSSILIYSLPSAFAGSDTTICANDTVQIGSAPVSNMIYQWYPTNSIVISNPSISNPLATPVSPVTNYILTVTDSNTSCVNTDSVVITMLDPIVANAGPDVEICRNDTVQIGAAYIESQIYSWTPDTGISDTSISSPFVSPDSTTIYTLTVTNNYACRTVTDEVMVLVHQLPDINAGPDDTITTGSSAQLVATGGVQYEWSPSWGLNNSGIYNPIAGPDSTITYIVWGTDIYGCSQSDTMTLTVLAPGFWLPTAFTPDNDGLNDVLYVRGSGMAEFEFSIFDRWGHTIFYSQDPSRGWDGTKEPSGEIMPEGAYVYVIKAVLSDGTPINQNGLINLVR